MEDCTQAGSDRNFSSLSGFQKAMLRSDRKVSLIASKFRFLNSVELYVCSYQRKIADFFSVASEYICIVSYLGQTAAEPENRN